MPARSLEDRAAATLAGLDPHRGPDDAGTYAGDGIGLANGRLAIIDVSSAGTSRWRSDDGRYVLVYNGELYNFRELARRARASRPSLPLAYRHRGRPPRLSGMGRRLPRPLRRHVRLRDLGRSRALSSSSRATGSASSRSTTPSVDGRFVFGSEVKAILEAGYRAEASPAGLARVLHVPERLLGPDAVRRASGCSRPGTSLDGRRHRASRASRATGISSPSRTKAISTERVGRSVRSGIRAGSRRGSS